jgi:hypothetical protein
LATDLSHTWDVTPAETGGLLAKGVTAKVQNPIFPLGSVALSHNPVYVTFDLMVNEVFAFNTTESGAVKAAGTIAVVSSE